jgi:hypothetical protein
VLAPLLPVEVDRAPLRLPRLDEHALLHGPHAVAGYLHRTCGPRTWPLSPLSPASTWSSVPCHRFPCSSTRAQAGSRDAIHRSLSPGWRPDGSTARTSPTSARQAGPAANPPFGRGSASTCATVAGTPSGTGEAASTGRLSGTTVLLEADARESSAGRGAGDARGVRSEVRAVAVRQPAAVGLDWATVAP